jgi:hypothetical protein
MTPNFDEMLPILSLTKTSNGLAKKKSCGLSAHFMCRPVCNFSQKRGIFEKFEIMYRYFLRCSCFLKSKDKSSNQRFSSKIIFTHNFKTFLKGNIGMKKIGTFSNFKVFVWIFLGEPKNCGFYFSSYHYSQPYEKNSCQRNFYFDLSFSLGMLLKVRDNAIF